MPDNPQPSPSSFVKQAAILAAAVLVARFLGFLYRMPLTALIGDKGNGYYGAGYNVYLFLLILSSVGLPAAISKITAEHCARAQFSAAHDVFRVSLRVAFVSGFVCAAALFFGARPVSFLIGNQFIYYSMLALSPTVLIAALAAVFRGYFMGLGTSVPTAISQVIEQVFNAVFSVVLAYFFMKIIISGVPPDALGAAGGTAGTGVGALFGLISSYVIYILLKNRVFSHIKADNTGYSYASDWQIAKKVIKTALPIITGTAIFSFSSIVDMLMVNRLLMANGAHTADQAVALYGQLTGKYVVLTTLPVAVVTAMAAVVVPTVAASIVRGDKAGTESKINTAFRLSMMVTIPAAVGMAVLGDQMLAMLFPWYPGGGMLLKVGSVSVVFLSLAQISTGILQGAGRLKTPAAAALIGVLVKIPINIFLIVIPSVNILGAVISTIACYVAASAIDVLVIRKRLDTKLDFVSGVLKPLGASACMGLVCYIMYYTLFYATGVNVLACLGSILIGILAYVGFMLAIRGFKRADVQLMPFFRRYADMIKE